MELLHQLDVVNIPFVLTIDHEEDQNVLELLMNYLDHQKQSELHKQSEVLDHLSTKKKTKKYFRENFSINKLVMLLY